MKQLIWYLGIFTLLISCQEKKQTNNESRQSVYNSEDTTYKINYYKKAQNNKYFSLKLIGDCDDALKDTIHKRYECYIESEIITDSAIIIDYKFKDACCKVFMGDYRCQNDTLIFEFEQVNEEVCACICWYRYRLHIKNLKTIVKHVIIKVR